MSWFKFKLLFVLLIALLSTVVSAAFTDTQCLQANFKTKVSHKGPPMGFLDAVLKVEKKDCVLTIQHEKLKYMKKKWMIDVCRGPVHIKYGTGSVDVLKRKGICKSNQLDDFCPAFQKLSQILQDDGLIFAKGEKENIEDDHGRIFCSYLLIQAYLEKGIIFSSDKSYENVLNKEDYISSVGTEIDPATSSTETKEEVKEEVKEEKKDGDW
jgi:hypothetical protein